MHILCDVHMLVLPIALPISDQTDLVCSFAFHVTPRPDDWSAAAANTAQVADYMQTTDVRGRTDTLLRVCNTGHCLRCTALSALCCCRSAAAVPQVPR